VLLTLSNQFVAKIAAWRKIVIAAQASSPPDQDSIPTIVRAFDERTTQGSRMKAIDLRRIAIGLLGGLALALGGLWLLQGAGLVQVRPILCFADCAEIQGTSTTWAIVGLIMAVLGAWGVVYSLRSPRRP
jgi:hypothetical protein